MDAILATGAAARAADILLRTLGGRSVLLRMPAPATPNDATEQLGLAQPAFQDAPLAPVACRKARATISGLSTNSGAPSKLRLGGITRYELLVSASAVQALVADLQSPSASILFADAFGIVIDGVLYGIVSATEEQVYAQPYVYRLILKAPLARTI
jgi:hypothetical protein